MYTSFIVGDLASKYILTVSGYSGTAGDSLAEHNGQRFTTRDQDNDAAGGNCAQTFKGAWWYIAYHGSNLNGLYHGGPHSSYSDGVNWYRWKGHYYSLKFTDMKMRRREVDQEVNASRLCSCNCIAVWIIMYFLDFNYLIAVMCL